LAQQYIDGMIQYKTSHRACKCHYFSAQGNYFPDLWLGRLCAR